MHEEFVVVVVAVVIVVAIDASRESWRFRATRTSVSIGSVGSRITWLDSRN